MNLNSIKMMTPTFRYLSIIFCLFTNSVFSQFRCGIDASYEQPIKAKDINLYKSLNEPLIAITASKVNTSSSYTIPVVVHVIETGTVLGTPEKPSDAQIMASIDALNKAYAATYPGYPNISNGGVDIGISFQLAQRDPDCNPTTGIVRIDKSGDPTFVNSYLTPADGMTCYNLSHWNKLEYCNIYITNNLNGANGFATIGGYPTPDLFDGVVIGSASLPAFSNYYPLYINKNPLYVISHEVGHYLGMHHTFNLANGSTCPTNANCLTDGDCVCDTDPHLQSCSTSTCDPSTINPCTGLPLGNLFHNYMSYFSDTIGLFTQGQKVRMVNTITQFRPDLINAMNLYPPQPTLPTVTIYAQYTNPYQAYCPGNSLDFYASGQNHGSSPQYAWYINGVLTTTTTSPGPITFTVNALDTVTCKLTSSSLCAITPTVISTKYNYPALMAGTLSVSLSHTNNDTLCIGDSLQVRCHINNIGSYNYFWTSSFNNPTQTATSSYPNIAYYKAIVDTSAIYTGFTPRWLYITCSIVSLTYCTTPTYLQTTDSVYIMGLKPPKPTLSFMSNYFQCSNAPYYQWYSVSSGVISGATSQTYIPTQNGNYYCVINNGFCNSIPSDTLNFMGTGISQYELNQTVSVYPNPASLELIVNSVNEIKKTELITISGQIISTFELQGKQKKLDISQLPNGVYILKVYSATGYVFYKKILVEKNN